MCKVNVLSDSEKRMTIKLNNGKMLVSEWYEDDGTKSDVIDKTIKENEVYSRLLCDNNAQENDVKEWYIARKREKETVYISDHAFDRIKERNGWKKKTAIRMVQKIYDNGLRVQDTEGYLNLWIRGRMISSRNNDEYVIYGAFAYIFNCGTLITVIPTPQKNGKRKGDVA